MTDYTYQVARLQDAYMAMQIAKKTKRAEIQAAHRKTLERIIREAEEEIERGFAQELHAANEAGLPGNVIRSEVLRTQDWGRWKKWRDLAQIEPDRVVAANARAAHAKANSPFHWAEDRSYFDVVRTLQGADLSEPIRVDIVWPDEWTRGEDPEGEYDRSNRKIFEPFGDIYKFRSIVDAEVTRAYEAGELENPNA